VIPFDQIRDVALAQASRLLAEWFPHGKVFGREFKVGNLGGDAGESLSINLTSGKWADFAAGLGGHDLIDLRAAMLHGGDRVPAARELGEKLGIIVNGHAHAEAPRREQRKADDDWQPIMPPPPGASKPDQREFERFDITYDYTDAEDRILFHVRRREAHGSERKQFVPLTYGALNGKPGWYSRHPAAPRSLYGLNRLSTMPDATVLLCEGEKAADAAQAMFPDYACITWPGGAKSVEYADLTPLAGRKVIIWPDNDAEGQKAASGLKRLLPLARVLRVDDLGGGDDAADIPAPDDPDGWLADRLPPPLRGLLSIQVWAERPMPAPDRLLGDLLTTTSRMFLVGRTGLGETLLGFAIACGMATGAGFLHWRCSRPVRVLLIDGEMPAELIKARAVDALRRIDKLPPPGDLVIYSRDVEDEFAERFPTLGKMEPLNTERGQQFVLALIAELGGVDVVIFDNVMSLIAGDQKDEVPWSETLPLVQSLSGKRIGQLWLDHTGHNADRQYGSSTKGWRFDTIGIMTPLPDDQRIKHEVAFTLSFEHPGKARRRTPDNWADFEMCTIRLADDRWTSEAAVASGPQKPIGKVPPTRQPFYDALVAAISKSATGPGRTTLPTWELECLRRGLIERPAAEAPKEHWQHRDARYRAFRKAKSDLLAAKWIAVEDDLVTDLKGRWS
jgi:hypothetical protein